MHFGENPKWKSCDACDTCSGAPEWLDFTAPPGKELSYRVLAIDADDGDKGASEPTEPVTL